MDVFNASGATGVIELRFNFASSATSTFINIDSAFASSQVSCPIFLLEFRKLHFISFRMYICIRECVSSFIMTRRSLS